MAAQFRIRVVSAAGTPGAWAKNFPATGGRPEALNSSVIFDEFFASVYERFEIQRAEGNTFTIRGVGSGLFISQYHFPSEDLVMGRGDGTPATPWAIQPAGNNVFVIALPNQNLLWTVRDDGSTALTPANGSAQQRFSFEQINV